MAKFSKSGFSPTGTTIIDRHTWEYDFESLLDAVEAGTVHYAMTPQVVVATAVRSCTEEPCLGRV